jgi:hypothetical protein
MGQLGFFLEDDHTSAGVLTRDLKSRGQADNAPAHNRNVHFFHHASTFSPELENFNRRARNPTNHSNRSGVRLQPSRPMVTAPMIPEADTQVSKKGRVALD